MKLADLIDRLIEIHNSKEAYNPEVSIMTEEELGGIEYQLIVEVTDIAVSDRTGVIIIGNEID